MSEATFRMNTLLSFTEIDAFNAQKNARSRELYFILLDNYINTAVRMGNRLIEMARKRPVEEFTEYVEGIQEDLLGIGASSLVLEMGKATYYARYKNRDKCVEVSTALAEELKTLADKIATARVDPGAASSRTGEAAPPSDISQQPKTARPHSAAKLATFEKLKMLIVNFELDSAMDMLRPILEYSYSEEIDESLSLVYQGLASFDEELAEEQIDKVIASIQALEASDVNNSKKKILAIDDMPDVLNSVKSVLGGKYMVYGVTNHKAALKFLTSNTASLILLDIEMPDMDGFSLLSIIRKIGSYQDTPVLFLTGSVTVENVKKSFSSGANDFIRKPIDAAVLLSKVEKHIGD